MSNSNDQSVYYVPHDGWYPVVLAAGLFFKVFGLGDALNAMKSGGDPGWVMSALGFSLFAVVLYFWFAKVIAENHAGLEVVEWGFDATVVLPWSNVIMKLLGQKAAIKLETGLFRRLWPYGAISVISLMREREEGS